MPERRPAQYFSAAELRCKCGCRQQRMAPDFLARLDRLREGWGQPLVLTSAYRCPAYNARVAATGARGPHTTGHAVDVFARGAAALDLLVLAVALGFTGIGVQQHGATRFLHLDDLPPAANRPRPTLWSY